MFSIYFYCLVQFNFKVFNESFKSLIFCNYVTDSICLYAMNLSLETILKYNICVVGQSEISSDWIRRISNCPDHCQSNPGLAWLLDRPTTYMSLCVFAYTYFKMIKTHVDLSIIIILIKFHLKLIPNEN